MRGLTLAEKAREEARSQGALLAKGGPRFGSHSRCLATPRAYMGSRWFVSGRERRDRVGELNTVRFRVDKRPDVRQSMVGAFEERRIPPNEEAREQSRR